MLKLIDVDYAYPGDIQALVALNLEIGKGEKLAILGPNGAGKSTLLMLLNGTLRPTRGTVLLDGAQGRYDKAGLRQWRQTAGLVLQDPDDQLFAATVFEDVSFGPLNQGLDDAEARLRVAEALEVMRISDLADRPTHMLSFGQRKRVALTGIVAMRPRVLLLDEPSAGLDPLGVSHLMAALERVSALGTTVVLTTHDMDLAYAWADRIAIFGDGQVAVAGAPADVFQDEAMLKRLRMRRPVIWEIATVLQRQGLIPLEQPLPRTRSALLEVLTATPA